MDSEMQSEAFRESKVMQDQDFSDNSAFFENMVHQDEQLPSATNIVLNNKLNQSLVDDEDCVSVKVESKTEVSEIELSDNVQRDNDTRGVHKSKSLTEGLEKCGENSIPTVQITSEHKIRCTGHEGLSQSEMDLNSIGKLPLERKASFFKKKMDSFVKNTSEVFRRQSQSMQRRGSAFPRMSVSLHSLNEESVSEGKFDDPIDVYNQGSVPILCSGITPAPSSSVSPTFSDLPPQLSQESLTGSRSELVGEAFVDISRSINSLNEDCLEVPLLSPRAVSMSSGLDSANRQSSPKSNRVTWLVSETLANYYRRMTPDGKHKQIQSQNSYQDFCTIPENKLYGAKASKGRRYSYVQAVSREDPVSSKFQEFSLRRKKVPENEMSQITAYLNNYTDGIPPLAGFKQHDISAEANALLGRLRRDGAIDEMFDWVGELDHNDAVRQDVIKEFITTEAVHIHHLQVIVTVYIAALHDLQQHNFLLNCNSGLLFQNIPDVLNANIIFWEQCIHPMVYSALTNRTLFDTSFMTPALNSFSEIFKPYGEYIYGQSNATDYFRKKIIEAPPSEFLDYIEWCNANTENRLRLGDMLIKPLQRLAKYSLLINRIASYQDDVHKKADLENADITIKKYMNSVNVSVRQKEALLELEGIKIEPFEPDFKGDDESLAYRRLSKLNLFVPMVECATSTMRCLIHQGDLRFKDNIKEFDARVFLFTDMMLICKKSYKGVPWRLVRPKILLHRVVPNIKPAKSPNELATALIYILLDEHGASKGFFQLSESSKDPSQSLKQWESKFQEALITYTLTKWYHTHPVDDIDIITREPDENYKRENPDLYQIEKRARDRVAAMLQPNKFMKDTSHEYELAMSGDPERGPYNLNLIMESGRNHYNAWQSRCSAFHQYVTSNSEFMEQNASDQFFSKRFQYRVGSFEMSRSRSSVINFTGSPIGGVQRSPSITVNIAPDVGDTQGPPALVLQQSSPKTPPEPRSASAGASSENMMFLKPNHPGGHSMPDINADYKIPEPVIVETASERLYRSHQELIKRNRLAAGQLFLSPNHRGSSYPPPSPTRASLKRGLAFSYSFKSNPPLTRSKNVISTSQTQIEKQKKDPRRILGRRSPQLTDEQASISNIKGQRSPSPSKFKDGKSGDKPEKKKSLFHRRSRESTTSANLDGQSHIDHDDGNCSRRSSKSEKDDKHTNKTELQPHTLNIEDDDEVIDVAGSDIETGESQASGMENFD